jgi:2-C-methyl-D-erythritol 4-phosphate cytidylyltransferase
MTAPPRPIVLALAPPAPGVSQGATTPALEMLGGARLIERLLSTFAELALPSPVIVTWHDSVPLLRGVVGGDVPVIGTDGERRGALDAALAATADELLLIHDAERALTPASVITDVLGALDVGADAALPVITMTDSVKAVRPEGLRNIDRSTVVGMQSPRLVRRPMLEQALSGPEPSEPQPATDPRATGETPSPRFDEILAVLDAGGQVRTVHGSHAGFAVLDRLSLWQAQISLGLARDTSHRYGLARRA